MSMPSIDLVYERERAEIERQFAMSFAMDAKVTTFFSVATAVIGFGIPFGLSVLDKAVAAYMFGAIPAAVAYLLATAAALPALRLRPLASVSGLRSESGLGPSASQERQLFLTNSLILLQEAYDYNDDVLERKRASVTVLPILLVIEIVLVLGWWTALSLRTLA